jgi:hypothetical protein
MACECTKSDFVPVRAGQRVCFGRARLSSLDEFRNEIGDGPVPVVMASFDEEGVEEQQLADTSDAIDSMIYGVIVSSN